MSKSTKRHPAAKICGRSDKRDKRIANRKFRRLTRDLLHVFDIDRLPVSLKEVSDTYNFSSDGLAFWMPCPRQDHPNPYWNEDAWKKMMRK
jgi:hypothetical protein